MDLGLSKNRESSNIVSKVWILTALFYLLRTIAEPLKYLFFISFGILLIYYAYSLLKDFKLIKFIKPLASIKEFLSLGLFLIVGILLSSKIEILSIKSLINFLGIIMMYMIYIEYKGHIKLERFIKSWIILTLSIGILGLLKWINFVFGLDLVFFSGFYKNGSSLVPDYNFYACYFLISLIIYLYSLNQKVFKIHLLANQAILFLFLINILLTGSRRSLLLLAVALLVFLILMITKRKEARTIFYRNLICFNTLIYGLLIIIITLIPFRSKIIHDSTIKARIATTIYRYSTIFIPNITYKLLYNKLWPRTDTYQNNLTNWSEYATYNNPENDAERNGFRKLAADYWSSYEKGKNPRNLIYNGDFSSGMKFWEKAAPDSIGHEIVHTKFGDAIRVSRFEGKGYWSLKYNGRSIYYYGGNTYSFKFKYRVLQGSGVPFMIGWWVNEGKGYKNNLSATIRKLDNEWFEYTASYKFINDQFNLLSFMNSQQVNSVVDITDIELTCDDIQDRPKYTDQIDYLDGQNLFYNSNFENGLKFWNSISYDTIKQELIKTVYGNAIRITRNEGKGYWPLAYQGRDIYYYKDLTYYFRFKFRVIKGGETPFKIGWWVEGEDDIPYDLHKNVLPLNEEWYECFTSYKFKNDHYGDIPTFMNSQEPNTIIDYMEIELLCNDSLNRPMYADEKIDEISKLEKAKLEEQFQETDNKRILSERINRWKYALEIWTAQYKWYNKLFGGGFDYLEMFGKKFYPDQNRTDYPHNPVISAFLYSGIIGGIFYIYFLALTIWYYWKYRKHHALFFILYLIILAFVFISSDSHFNVPIFAVLSLIPFITKQVIEEKEQENLT